MSALMGRPLLLSELEWCPIGHTVGANKTPVEGTGLPGGSFILRVADYSRYDILVHDSGWRFGLDPLEAQCWVFKLTGNFEG